VEVVEESALIKFKDRQEIITLKGVGSEFQKHSELKNYVIAGDFYLQQDDKSGVILGAGIAYHLGYYFHDFNPPVSIFLPKRTRKNFTGTFDQSFNSKPIQVSAVFGLQQEFDAEYAIVPLQFARDLLEYSDEVTSLEIGLESEADPEYVQREIQTILGPDFSVKTQFQQQEVLYKVLNSEKWVTFLILTFILLIAAFNVIGSLSMLILEKKKDIAVLWSLGADKKLVKCIFTMEGLLISVFGGFAGLILGGILAFLQQKFGFIKLGGGSYVVDAYPVLVHPMDFILVMLTVTVIGLVTVWFPVRRLSEKYISGHVSFFLMR